MFEIGRIDDGRIGSRAERLPMTYQSEAFAEQLAGPLGRAEAGSFGDAAFKVVPVGQSAFVSRHAS